MSDDQSLMTKFNVKLTLVAILPVILISYGIGNVNAFSLPDPPFSDDQVKPTFGKLWFNDYQAVENGFTLNGESVTITNNESAQVSTTLDDENSITVKVYSHYELSTIGLVIGASAPGKELEAGNMIYIEIERDDRGQYTLVGADVRQVREYIDPDTLVTTVSSANCNGDDRSQRCAQVTVDFDLLLDTQGNIIAAGATDVDDRYAVIHITAGR